MKYFRYVIMSFLLCPVVYLIAGCGREEYRSIDGVVWNTTYHIVYAGPKNLSDSVIAVLDSVGNSLNFFSKVSLLSKLNASDSLKVDRHIVNVYDMSVKINRESDGMFDPTLSPLITAWGFGKGHRPTSDTLRIDSLMRCVGLGRTVLRNNVIIKENPAITFNFSAVAKGYGCDCVAGMFRKNGVENFMVEIGGEIMANGVNPSGKPWRISIDTPDRDSLAMNHKSQGVIAITGKGMATSGNYRNYHKSDGGRYFGHTISPKTGRPVSTDILSATIISSSAMEADAVATACMVMGSVDALEMCKRLNCEGMLILKDTILTTSGFVMER